MRYLFLEHRRARRHPPSFSWFGAVDRRVWRSNPSVVVINNRDAVLRRREDEELEQRSGIGVMELHGRREARMTQRDRMARGAGRFRGGKWNLA